MKMKKTLLPILTFMMLLMQPVTGAYAQNINADQIIAQLKSDNPLEQLKAFNSLEVTNEEVMSNMVDAVNQKPCAYQFLENFSLSEKASNFIDVLKTKVPPSKDVESEYCGYYSMGNIQLF